MKVEMHLGPGGPRFFRLESERSRFMLRGVASAAISELLPIPVASAFQRIARLSP